MDAMRMMNLKRNVFTKACWLYIHFLFPGGAGDPPATSECRLDGGVRTEEMSAFIRALAIAGAGFKPTQI
jgi:hypothetical protein